MKQLHWERVLGRMVDHSERLAALGAWVLVDPTHYKIPLDGVWRLARQWVCRFDAEAYDVNEKGANLLLHVKKLH